jgi:hypothetical protein
MGLQLLNDAILGQITCFNNMAKDKMQKNLREYAGRYVEFMKGVVKGLNT